MDDFKHTTDGDIDLNGNDIAYDTGDAWHKRDIIIQKQGDIKATPLLGVGVRKFFNDENTEPLLRSIRKNFTRDGMKVRSVGIDNNVITEDSYYE